MGKVEWVVGNSFSFCVLRFVPTYLVWGSEAEHITMSAVVMLVGRGDDGLNAEFILQRCDVVELS